jgi:hypothetical protein
MIRKKVKILPTAGFAIFCLNRSHIGSSVNDVIVLEVDFLTIALRYQHDDVGEGGQKMKNV